MRRAWWALLTVLVTATAAAAQQESRPADDPARAEQLRQQIEDRFAERVRRQLDLSDEQMTKLRGTARTYGTRRRELGREERDLRAALAEQLRPGVAANQDSVSRITDALVNLRGAYAQTFRDENREMSAYLTPVQRSQLFVMRERLMRRAREIREERRGLREEQGRAREDRGERRPRPRGQRALRERPPR
ncbi:MAG TPA: Spy/CpxP family protein refolding chaperone [Gemmatimonadales bacterium]|nr:Spy/CpxP family protein refolding chaperone [Gemmatimonadales bacterium]